MATGSILRGGGSVGSGRYVSQPNLTPEQIARNKELASYENMSPEAQRRQDIMAQDKELRNTAADVSYKSKADQLQKMLDSLNGTTTNTGGGMTIGGDGGSSLGGGGFGDLDIYLPPGEPVTGDGETGTSNPQSFEQMLLDQIAGLEKSKSSAGLSEQGQGILDANMQGLQGLGSYFGNLAQGDYRQSPEGKAESAGIASSMDKARDSIRQNMAARGITDERYIQDQMNKVDVAGAQSFAELPLKGREMAMQYIPKMTGIASQFQESESVGGSPTAGISGLLNYGNILQNQQNSIMDLLQGMGFSTGY